MKKKKYVNVIFISSDWSIEHRKNLYKELFSEVNEWSEVVIVQQAVGIVGHLFTKFKQKIIGLITGKYRTKRLYTSVVLFTPIILFHYGLWLKKSFISFIDIFLFKKQLEKFLNKRFKECSVVLWVYNPHFYYFTERFKHDFLVYDYMDNLDFDSSGNYNLRIANLNNHLIKKSNLIICTASYLFQRINKINASSIYVNNGNNYNVLTNKTNDKITEISNINMPIIGYLGGIRDWLDYELLNYLINNLTNTSFVFIGILHRNSKNDFKKILKNKNVIWINFKEQEELHHYLRQFSVGIIPFKINEFMKGVFPNKFFEYMACEIPIVTTELPELKQYSEIIGYSKNKEEFLENCKLAITGRFKKKTGEYSKIAYENSWENKANIIDDTLREKLILQTGSTNLKII